MSINDVRTVQRLSKIVARLTSHLHLREDLMQEALIHLWRTQEQQPGHSESWYLQSCRYHLQHFLAAGRSVDSHKRRSANVDSVIDGEGECGLFEIDEVLESGETILAHISVRDLIQAMSHRLSTREQAVLRCLAEGWKTCEIAQRLNVSHPTVIKDRRKIAAMANELNGISGRRAPKPNGRAIHNRRQRNAEDVLMLAG